MTSTRIPGIVRISFIDCSTLPPNIMFDALSGNTVCVVAPHTDIRFFGEAKLVCDGSMVNGQRQEKSTLTFMTADPMPEGVHLAFVATCANGRQYIIGAREGRFPVIGYSETTGTRSGDRAVRTYKITHLAQKSMLPCVL